MEGTVGSSDCPRAGDSTWLTTVRPANRTTGMATDRHHSPSAVQDRRRADGGQARSAQRVQTQAVEHHDHTGQSHGHRRHQGVQKAECRQRKGGDVVAHGPSEVLHDDRVGRPGRRRPRPGPLGGRCRASATSLLASAASEPLPMAHPTSAAASAGASLTPSPTMTTGRECWPSVGQCRHLAGRAQTARASEMPSAAATVSTAGALSPLRMDEERPIDARWSTAAWPRGAAVWSPRWLRRPRRHVRPPPPSRPRR